jgi:outer membrane protein assembly factor BamB
MHRSFSSVVIHDGLAVIPDFSGLVHCLDAATGEPQWSYDMLSSAWGTPLLADGKIYIGDEDGDVAILELSRQLKLLAEINVGKSVYTTIMAADGALYIPSQGRLWAIKTSGPAENSPGTAIPTNSTSLLGTIGAHEGSVCRIESICGDALKVTSRLDGTTQEIVVEGRCRFVFGEGDAKVVAEADKVIVRGWSPNSQDFRKAKFHFRGNTLLRIAESEIRADSIQYDAARRRFQSLPDEQNP